MPIKLNPTLKLTVASGLAAAILSGCGIRGDLKVPPPLFGEGNVDPERVPTKDLDREDRPDPNDLLDQDFLDSDGEGLDDDPFSEIEER